MRTPLLTTALIVSLSLVLSACCGEAIEQQIKAIEELPNAPGMQELRDAGCTSAIPMPITGRISCNIEHDKEMTCEDAAGIYGAAVTPAPKEFELALIDWDKSKNPDDPDIRVRCEGVFNAKGEKLRDVKVPTKVGKRNVKVKQLN